MQLVSSYILRIGGTSAFDSAYLDTISPDLFIVERSYISSAQIQMLEMNGTEVAGYMNLGRIDVNRDYIDTFPGLGANGAYADISDPDWVAAMQMEVDELLTQGFDILYFDDLLAYNDGPNATALEMINLVNTVVAYARSQNPDVEFIYNGAPYIRTDAELDANDPAWLQYMAAAAAFQADNYYDEFIGQGVSAINYYADAASEFSNSQLLAIEQVGNVPSTEHDDFISDLIGLGFVPFVGPFEYTDEEPAYQQSAGTAAADWVEGTAASEELSGLQGSDVVLGGAGNDTLFGGTGIADPNDAADFLSGGTGNDVIYGNGGFDTITGGQGNDSVSGGVGEDLISGGHGNDTLLGSNDNDTIYGGQGIVDPSDAADLIFGEGGSDALYGNGGNDTIYGGLSEVDPSDAADQIFGGVGNDLIYSNGGDDTVDGGTDNDTIYGGFGADSLLGGTQEDQLYGLLGNDTLRGGAGFDLLEGGEGTDLLDGGAQADNLLGGTGNDTMLGGSGFDRLFGQEDDDLGYGGDGTDALFGQEGNDTLFGQNGNDRFYGGIGNDILDGGASDDLLIGGAGFDTLLGSTGNDTMTGAFNADVFVFTDFGGGFGNDVITDFAANNNFEDINLRGVSGIVDFNDLVANHMTQAGADVVIDDGSGNTITLLNVNINDLLDDQDFIF